MFITLAMRPDKSMGIRETMPNTSDAKYEDEKPYP